MEKRGIPDGTAVGRNRVWVWRALLFFVVVAFVAPLQAEERSPKRVPFVGSNPNTHQEPTAVAGWAVYHALQDQFFYKVIDPQDGKTRSGPGWAFLRTFWNFWLMYELVLAPHELGHWTRHREFGNDWLLHNWKFFIPDSDTVIKNPNSSFRDIAMGKMGGLEINHTMALMGQKAMYQRGWANADELLFNSINKIQFNLYTFLYQNVDKNDPDTWTDPWGDPADYTVNIFRHYYNRPVVSGGVIDSKLLKIYNEMLIAGLWNFLDPTVFYSLYAAGKSAWTGEREAKLPWFETGPVGWMYGTQFNLSPLGYELYLHLYTKVAEQFWSTYFRYGRPRENYGMGVEFPKIVSWKKTAWGGGFDLWDQEAFNFGGSGHFLCDFALTDWLALTAKLGLKKEGYLMAQPQAGGAYGYGGVAFSY